MCSVGDGETMNVSYQMKVGQYGYLYGLDVVTQSRGCLEFNSVPFSDASTYVYLVFWGSTS